MTGGENFDSMLESEKKATCEHIPGIYSRQYLPLSRKVGDKETNGVEKSVITTCTITGSVS